MLSIVSELYLSRFVVIHYQTAGRIYMLRVTPIFRQFLICLTLR